MIRSYILILFFLAFLPFSITKALAYEQDYSVSYDIKKWVTNNFSKRINNNMNSWLDQYGTASVNVNFSDQFLFSDVDLEFLLPLQDKDKFLWFFQNNYHKNASKNSINTGMGLRLFSNSTLIGANSFFDYDFNNSHYRLSAGLEYWKNYLKLSANYYLGLSDWRLLPHDVYDSKPANGFDARINAYLPFWPSLGFNISYEKYIGSLAPISKFRDHSQFFTLGVSYTFVPLLTLSNDYRYQNQNSYKSTIKIDATYRFGIPLLQQLDPRNVDFIRTIAGSRYDFVERNNDIILEYDKSSNIEINKDISGIEGEKKFLFKNIIPHKDLEIKAWQAGKDDEKIISRLSWECSNALNLDACSITLPPYDAQGLNQYVLTLVLYNSKTDNFYTAEAHITVKNDPSINGQNFSLSIEKQKLLLDGEDPVSNYTDIYLKITDRDDILEKDLKFVIMKNNQKIEEKNFKENAKGYYTGNLAVYKANGYTGGTYQIFVKLKNKLLYDVKTTFTIDDALLYPKKSFTTFKTPDILYVDDPENKGSILVETKDFYNNPIQLSDFIWQIEIKDKNNQPVSDAAKITYQYPSNSYTDIYEIEALKAGQYNLVLSYKKDRNDIQWNELSTESINIVKKLPNNILFTVSSKKDEVIINYKPGTDSNLLTLNVTNEADEPLNLDPALYPNLEFVVIKEDTNQEIASLPAKLSSLGCYEATFFASKLSKTGHYNIKIRSAKIFLPSVDSYFTITDGALFPSPENSYLTTSYDYLIKKGDRPPLYLHAFDSYGNPIKIADYQWKATTEDKHSKPSIIAGLTGSIATNNLAMHAWISGFALVVIYYKRPADVDWIKLTDIEFQIQPH